MERIPIHLIYKVCVCLVLFARYSELFVESRLFGAPVTDDPHWNIIRSFGIKNNP